MKPRAFMVFRDGQYLGAGAWLPSERGALAFGSQSDAEAGLSDMRSAARRLFTGTETIVERNAVLRPPDAAPPPQVNYDPFGRAL